MSKIKIGAVVAAGLLLLTSCGTSPANSTGKVEAPNNINNLPPSVAQGVNALLGNYGGTLIKTIYTAEGDSFETPQPYNLNLTTAQYPGRPAEERYAYFTLNSYGSAGTVNYQAYLNTVYNGLSIGGSVVYKFQSLPESIAGLSNSKISIEITIALVNGYQFDPAQSRIRILDCGFSQGITCSSDANGVRFGNDFGKR